MVLLTYNKNSKGEKQMKKLTALVLSFGMLFSMAACSGSKVNDDALDKLETSVKKFSEVKSANYSADMDMTVDKENAKIKLYGDFITETKKPLQLSMTLDMEASGQKVEKYMQLHVKDDTMYMNMMDMMKQKTSLKDAMGTASIPNMNFDADTFKMNKEDMKKYLKEASVKGNDLKLSFDVEKINEEAKKQTKKNNVTDANVEFKKLDMDVTLNNDFMEKAVITLEMTNTKGETKQELNGTVSLTIKDINKVSNIDFPDFKDYKEGSIQ